MSMQPPRKDLIALVADKNLEFALRGVLTRPRSLGIREISFEINIHMERDPGCFQKGAEFLRALVAHYNYALVVFDRIGSGQEKSARVELEFRVESEMQECGWRGRSASIVIDPELDIWIWSNSPHVDRILGWTKSQLALRRWLVQEAFINASTQKPSRPKEALEAALRLAKKPRSSSIYFSIANKVSLKRCVDPAFLKLKSVLINWFGTGSSP